MGYSPKKVRLPWEDQFNTPSMDDLRRHYPKQLGNLLETARSNLLAFEGVREELAWQGVPWRWTLTYSCPDDPTRAWAYLVPDPLRPKIALPLTEEMVEALPMRRLKKFVRDGVVAARRVNTVYWATWEITNRSQLEEILELARRKHQYIMARTN